MLSPEDFICHQYDLSSITDPLTLESQAPSNIALVKYWGKYPGQIPMNPSISFTLTESRTLTQTNLSKKKNKKSSEISFKFYFEDQHKPAFEPKIYNFFQNILIYAPYLKELHLEINSRNTFPHSSGIASSASAFAALSKMIINLEKKITVKEYSEDYWKKKASFLARIGSGSASRSIDRPLTIWGEHLAIEKTNNYYAVLPDFKLHQNFKNYQDSIVLVEEGQKKVSSTAGHQLMEKHPFKKIRIRQAIENILKITDALKNGNLPEFIEIVEAEALELHALMMTSQPNYLLMQPETLHLIHQIRDFRKKTGSHLCFTLDAGANVHVLYPEQEKNIVARFLKNVTSKKIITDHI